MIRKLVGSCAAALGLWTVMAGPVQAGALPAVEMNVPFDFVVSGKTMPAGRYAVTESTNAGGAAIFTVRNQRTRTGAYSVMAQRRVADTEKKTANAVFVCRAGDCFLSEIEVPGLERYTAQVPASNAGAKERLVSLNLATASGQTNRAERVSR